MSTPDQAVAAREAPSGASAAGDNSSRVAFARYLAGKIVSSIVSLIVTLIIGFFLFNALDDNPVATATRGRPVTEAEIGRLNKLFGVGLPWYEKFTHYVDNVVHLRLGYSYTYRDSVASIIGDRIWPTVLLVGTATAISVALGLWLGVRSGWKAGSLFDRMSSGVSITLWSVPTFWLGILLLVLFAVGLGPISGILPTGGMNTPDLQGNWLDHALDVVKHMILPVITLVLVVFAQYVTIMRASVIDELGRPYLLTARAKGLRDDVVRRRHAVPNALLPSVTVIFLQIGGIVGGAITVETVFSWPGLGDITYRALQIPDVLLLQGTFLIFSVSVIVMNLVADVLYRFLDPRVRAQ